MRGKEGESKDDGVGRERTRMRDGEDEDEGGRG